MKIMDYSFYLIADCFARGSYPSLCMGSFGFSFYLSFDTYALLREVSNPTIRAITDHYILVEAFLLLSYFALFWFYYKRNNRYKAIFEHYSQKRAQYKFRWLKEMFHTLILTVVLLSPVLIMVLIKHYGLNW